ncbi:hypothetical protein AX769_21425 (plasmid) [Frondihabitans sp. PAMC 28766]|nr:hypothetical protein AX769_21425 [Frondihabitans sp. PAMC 28766]
MTRSSSAHPADWGRAIALALEYLAVQVAYTVREPESGVLVGRDIRLHFDALDDGVEITAELDAPRLDSRPGPDSHESERDLRISVGYGYGESPNADDE